MSVARACIRCGRRLKDGTFCSRCDERSIVRLCRHLAALPAWRTTTTTNGSVKVDSITVGSVTIFPPEGTQAMMPLVHSETGRTIPAREPRSVPSGSEIVMRATILGACYSCGLAFLLPEVEAGVRRGEPRILRQRIGVWVQTISEPWHRVPITTPEASA